MAAPDLTVSRLGQTNGAGDAKSLFLKKFAGEVIGAFEEANVFMGLHTVRTIENGKSAQFPAMGKATAAYHTPGAMIVGTALNHAERVISIDELLVASASIATLDDLMNHYDVRGEYAKQLAAALSKQADQRLARLVVLAARASATVSGLSAGQSVIAATALTSGSALAGAIFDAAQKLDEVDVPENDRYCVVKPEQYYNLVQTTDVINRDWGGRGAYADGTVLKVAGINIIKSNHFPAAAGVVAAVTGENNTYNGDFTNTAACVFHRSAIGTVKLLDLATSVDWIPQNQAHLMIAKYAMGHGILRPEASVEIKIA